jgi:hypothetical protein
MSESNFLRPGRIPAQEWAARVQLAAAYRISAHLGWSELTYNHMGELTGLGILQ